MLVLVAMLIAADAPAASATAHGGAAKAVFATPGDMVWTSATSMRFSASAPMLASRPASTPTAAGGPNDFSGEAALGLAVDYFLVKRFSLGGFARASYTWSPMAYGPGFDLGPRIGYSVPFSDWVSVWPRLDLSFGAQGSFGRDPAAPSMATMVWHFNASLHMPLVFSILDHVLLGIGPYFAFQPQWVADTPGLSAFALNFGVSTFVGWHY